MTTTIEPGYYLIENDRKKALGEVTKSFEWTYFEWAGTDGTTDPVDLLLKRGYRFTKLIPAPQP